MDLVDAIPLRHSVRSYIAKPIEPEKIAALNAEILSCNEKSGLSMRLVINESDVFNSFLAHYGKFRNVNNCIIVSAPEELKDVRRKCGFYGQRLVLYAQTLGLNTCWAGLTFSKKAAKKYVPDGSKLFVVIALGYGDTQGKPRRTKSYSDVCNVSNPPEWFKLGVEAALLAPTALNQQKFKISLSADGEATFDAPNRNYPQIDLGIVECNFRIAEQAYKKITENNK